MCITGLSGSGKSVLIRVASGLLAPDAGQVFVGGRAITALDEQELLELRGPSMGIMFQEQSLFTGMSVYDNASIAWTNTGNQGPSRKRHVQHCPRAVLPW